MNISHKMFDVSPRVVMKCPRCYTYDDLQQVFIWGIPFEYPVCLKCREDYVNAVWGNTERIAVEAQRIAERVLLALDRWEGESEREYMLRKDIRLYWVGADKELLCERPENHTTSSLKNTSTTGGSSESLED